MAGRRVSPKIDDACSVPAGRWSISATVKKGRYFLAALLAAGTATFLFALLRKRHERIPPLPYARPEGGEREGEFELFIGS